MLKIKHLKYSVQEFVCNYHCPNISEGIIGIVGRSGSGKSTLFNLIAGYLSQNHGKILIDDNDISNMEVGNRDISILFQSFNNFDHLSIFQNIILGIDPKMKKHNDNIQLVNKAMKQLDLKMPMETIVNTLSGGEQQRVSLARAFIRKNPVLLLDEPFNSLDPGLRKTLYKDLVRITKFNPKMTILISSHYIEELKSITNKFIYIDQGRIYKSALLTYNELLSAKNFKLYMEEKI